MSHDSLIHAVIFSTPPPLLHLCALGTALEKKKSVFQASNWTPASFLHLRASGLAFSRACFQFLGGPDEDE